MRVWRMWVSGQVGTPKICENLRRVTSGAECGRKSAPIKEHTTDRDSEATRKKGEAKKKKWSHNPYAETHSLSECV